MANFLQRSGTDFWKSAPFCMNRFSSQFRDSRNFRKLVIRWDRGCHRRDSISESFLIELPEVMIGNVLQTLSDLKIGWSSIVLWVRRKPVLKKKSSPSQKYVKIKI